MSNVTFRLGETGQLRDTCSSTWNPFELSSRARKAEKAGSAGWVGLFVDALGYNTLYKVTDIPL